MFHVVFLKGFARGSLEIAQSHKKLPLLCSKLTRRAKDNAA